MISGPKLPDTNLICSSLVTSPTGRGVVLIGGYNRKEENGLFELTGDSKENLKWEQIKPKLEHGRYQHLSIPLSNEAFLNLDPSGIF